jgi:CBS-domain-containing membrane protein
MLRAKDVMTRQVHTVSPETAVEELAQRFLDTKVSTLPVVDAHGTLIGIVTETDLVEQNKPLHIPTVIAVFDWVLYLESEKNFQDDVRRISARKVGEICSRELVTCSPETPVSEIAGLMSEKKVHLVPVLDGAKLVGVVARLDLIRSMRG